MSQRLLSPEAVAKAQTPRRRTRRHRRSDYGKQFLFWVSTFPPMDSSQDHWHFSKCFIGMLTEQGKGQREKFCQVRWIKEPRRCQMFSGNIKKPIGLVKGAAAHPDVSSMCFKVEPQASVSLIKKSVVIYLKCFRWLAARSTVGLQNTSVKSSWI